MNGRLAAKGAKNAMEGAKKKRWREGEVVRFRLMPVFMAPADHAKWQAEMNSATAPLAVWREGRNGFFV